MITERELDLAVDIVLDDYLVFRVRLGTTGPENDPWLLGKAAVARYFEEPSLLVRRRVEASGQTVADVGLDPDAYRAHGGSIPLRAGGEIVGTITVSGEPDVVDHIDALHAKGVTGVVVCPIGFVSDHLEVVWDLDTEARDRAAELGMEFARAATPNSDPRFAELVVELVAEHTAGAPARKLSRT